jgi:hypothetical protein
MSFYQSWVERLQATRTNLSSNVQINSPENYSKLTGTLDFLLNPSLNPRTIDVIQNQNSQAGTYRSVEVRYQPHWGTEDLITNDANFVCTKGSQRRDYISTHDVTLVAGVPFTLEEDYIRQNSDAGDSQQARLDRGFKNAMRVARESMSAQLLAKMAANLGSNPAQSAGAGSYTSVQMINSDGGADVNNFDIFLNDAQDNFMSGPVAIIGQGGNSRKYFNRLAVGNLNTNAGVNIQDVAQQFGGIYFQDQSATVGLAGANKVIAAYPGLTQFYGYNLYKGVFSKNSPDNLIKGTMPDPIYGFDWDFKISYDDGCDSGNGLQGAWVVTVFKYFDLFTVPSDAFGDTYGELNDFNGLVGYTLTSA